MEVQPTGNYISSKYLSGNKSQKNKIIFLSCILLFGAFVCLQNIIKFFEVFNKPEALIALSPSKVINCDIINMA